jgi:hypothetical protein
MSFNGYGLRFRSARRTFSTSRCTLKKSFLNLTVCPFESKKFVPVQLSIPAG